MSKAIFPLLLMVTLPKAQIPEALDFLFQPARYKAAYGGRGSAKSWSFARAVIIKAMEKPTRILCCREIQNSIAESVHKLLSDQIDKLGVSRYFDINDKSITCANGSEFIFKGLYRNVKAIKSLEGIDICWVEEAESITEESLKVLKPTIRKEDSIETSEIWFSWNTGHEDDPIYEWLVTDTPKDAIVRLVNFYDNPWFPEVLRKEMEADKARDRALYENVWLGKPTGKGGRVWPKFSKEVHIKDTNWDEISEHGNCFMAMDPHSHYYPFCVWLAIYPKNKRGIWPEDFYKHVYAEWPTVEDMGGYYHDMRKKVFYTGSLLEMATSILGRDGAEFGAKVMNRFIDTRFAKGSGSWNWSTSTGGIVEQFSRPENGGLLFTLPGESVIDAQRMVIRGDMDYNHHQPLGPFNDPSFSVSPTCKNMIASLQSHRLEEDSEREAEKYKDPSDALRILYAGMAGIQYQALTTSAKEKRRRRTSRRTGSWMG